MQLNLVTDKLSNLNLKYNVNEPLKNHTTFKIGGNALVFCEISEISNIIEVINFLADNGIRYYLLGNGSNVLFCDEGFAGVVIKLTNNHIEFNQDIVKAGAGVSLAELCKAAAEKSLSGLEFAFGIPGLVGGATYMNAGAYGGEMKDVIKSVTYLSKTGKVQCFTAGELGFSYRHSVFEVTGECILEVEFQLKKAEKQAILDQMHLYSKQRAEKQPLDMPSAGSTFKRPQGAFAGALIDECGLRGFKVGGAAISEKHCGFVVNVDNATCQDVIDLTEQVSKIVKEKTGFTLEREIRVVK